MRLSGPKLWQPQEIRRWGEIHLHRRDPLEMNAAAIQMVEALWMLTYFSVCCYKNRYESDSTSLEQASSNPDFTCGLTPTGARLKKVMTKRH